MEGVKEEIREYERSAGVIKLMELAGVGWEPSAFSLHERMRKKFRD